MQKYILVIEYIGTNYAGSQKQGCQLRQRHVDNQQNQNVQLNQNNLDKEQNTKTSNTPVITIQGELEKAISTLTKQKSKTIFSGRTDAGVHAREQYVHFETDHDCCDKTFIKKLNGLLPQDISVKKVQKAEKTFHAQKSAIGRWYRYTIVNRTQRSAWDKNCLLVRESLDIDRMNKALSYLQGNYDFTSFKKLKSTNPAKICNIYKAICIQQDDKIVIDIIANRFLYNMVRTIVGTLLMIEKNSLAPETLKEILESKDRNKAGSTISPQGLTLMKVIYNETDLNETLKNINR